MRKKVYICGHEYWMDSTKTPVVFYDDETAEHGYDFNSQHWTKTAKKEIINILLNMGMKATINITQQYGFAHYWHLNLTHEDGRTKSFYLGQDVKFCTRVLGREPKTIADELGFNDLSIKENQDKLGEYILNLLIEEHDLSEEQIFDEIPAWGLAAD